jgi:hypothetical protein
VCESRAELIFVCICADSNATWRWFYMTCKWYSRSLHLTRDRAYAMGAHPVLGEGAEDRPLHHPLPGVRSVSAAFPVPLRSQANSAPVRVPGLPSTPEQMPNAIPAAVEPNCFETLGVRRIAARTLIRQDGLAVSEFRDSLESAAVGGCPQ